MNTPAYPGNIPPPANSPAPRPPATPAQQKARRRKLAFVACGALIFVALMFVRYAAEPVEEAGDQPDRLEQSAALATDPQPAVPDPPAPESVQVESAGFAAPVVVERPTPPVVKARPKKAAVTSAKTRVAASAKPPATSAVSAPIAPAPIAKAPANANATAIVGRTVSVSTEVVRPAPVTLTGCLETSVNRDEFRLSDAAGVDAPRSRTWRTAFLTKRSTPVALVESPDPHGMLVQVGKRVEATGQLVDREMKVSSVRVVSNTCD